MNFEQVLYVCDDNMKICNRTLNYKNLVTIIMYAGLLYYFIFDGILQNPCCVRTGICMEQLFHKVTWIYSRVKYDEILLHLGGIELLLSEFRLFCWLLFVDQIS